MSEVYAERLATAIHFTLGRLADQLTELSPEAVITAEDLRNTLLELAESLPAPE